MKLLGLNKLNTIQRLILVACMVVFSRLLAYLLYGLLFGDFSFAGFVSGMNRYDSTHYNRIATMGYLSDSYSLVGEAGWAFFPLYPAIIGLLHILTGASTYALAFFVGNALLFGAILFGMKYIEATGGSDEAQWIYAILATFGCYSFYCSIFYTEALWLFLISACFYFLEKKRYLLLGALGALLSATRNLGIFFEFVILVKWIMDYFESRKESGLSFKEYLFDSLKNPSLVLGVSMIPAGFFAYMLLLYTKVGDALAFVHVQYAWERNNSFFVRVLINGLKEITGYGAYLGWWAVAGLWIAAILIIKYKKYHEALLLLICLILPMQSTLDSIPRFLMGIFVFWKTISVEISQYKWYNKMILIMLMCGYELILLNGWFFGEGVLC